MKLYKAFATVGGLTMVSRCLGFGRDILIAAGLGTGPVADAFVVAFQFPNLFRRLFGEGAFNSAFVPLFSRRLAADGRQSAHRFAEEALAGLLFVLLIVTAVAELTMPWLMYAIAPGFSADPAKFDLTVLLTRIAFPYLLCMSLVALLSGVLNALGRFTAAAAAPILLNLVLISVLALASWLGVREAPDVGIILCWGVAIAGFVQLFMLSVAAYRAGMGFGFRRPRMTEGVRRLVQLGIPGVIAGGITQLNLQIGGFIASFQPGARSYLYYADRLYQLPLGIVGVAIGVVLLPELSRRLRAGEHAAVMDSQNRSFELALLLTMPAAIALWVAAEPIVSVLYERGKFGATDTPATAWALAAFAWGLPAFVLQKVFQPGFFAREDTRTPMRFAAVNFGVNVVASVILFIGFQAAGLMPHVGIALATTLAGWINVVLLWTTLARRGHFEPDARLKRNGPLIVLASVVMGAVIWLAAIPLRGYFAPQNPLAVKFSAMGGLILLGAAVFFGLLLATKAMPAGGLTRAFKRAPRPQSG